MASAQVRGPRKKPTGTSQVLIALLRGVNVGGNKRVPMADLRRLALALGCSRVETYIQSGNLVVSSELTAPALETQLEAALLDCFGFSVEVVVRTALAFFGYAAGTPFPDAQVERPNLLLLGVSKLPLLPGAVAALRGRATSGERVEAADGALWFDFIAGSGRSKLSPSVIDRAAGSTVTTRNWNTVRELAALAARQAEAG
jgi:uncharacterized protein (DUF1697 family)